MDSVKSAQNSLKSLKDNVIGIFQIHGNFELILKENVSTLDTVNITKFGAIQLTYGVGKNLGKFKLFPNHMNMNEMLSSPFDWQDFMKHFE